MIALDAILTRVQHELSLALGDELLSLCLVGSAAVGDFVPEASDVNLLAVVKRVDLAVLDRTRRAHRRLVRYRVSAPLLLTPEDLSRSADVFPMEFHELQEKRRVLYGPDLLENIKFSAKNLRHECEHDLKGRLIRLRESYLELGDHPRRLRGLLLAAHAANFPVFRAALRLKQVQPPLAKDEVVERVAEHFGLEAAPFRQLQSLRRAAVRLDRGGLRRCFEAYLHEVEKLARVLDRL